MTTTKIKASNIEDGSITAVKLNADVIATTLPIQTSHAGQYLTSDGTDASWALLGNAATVTTNANLTGGVTSIGNAATVITNANLTGGVTSVGNATTVITNANLTGVITSSGNATSIASQTGTGTKFVVDTSPVLITPNLGTPSALVGTNISGTAAGLTAGAVTNGVYTTGSYSNPAWITALANNKITGLGSAALLTAGSANGVATLDGGGTVPTAQLPAAVLGALKYQGTWNATTNVPTLTSSVGTQGYYYVVATAGTTNLDGIASWAIGDWAIFGTATWQKIDNTDAVTSVNGFTGTVSIAYADLAGAIPTWNQNTTGNAATVTTNANLTGSVTSIGNAATVVTNANLTGVITSSGNATSIASQTGTGSKFVVDNSPTLTTPVINGFTGDTSVINIGSGQVYKDASGNVGIGTASPSQKLTAYNGSSRTLIRAASDLNFSGAYLGTATASNRGASLELLTHVDGSNAAGWKQQVAVDVTGNYNLTFSYAGSSSTYAGLSYTERMRLDDSGNLGIGTSSPSSYFSGGQNLVISKGAASGMTIDGTTSGNASLFFAKGTTGAQQYAGWVQYNTGTDALVLGSNAAERMRIDSAGNVGIGTTAPGGTATGRQLTLQGTTATASFFNGTFNLNAGNNGSVGYLEVTGANPLAFYTNGSERIRIDSAGNVGIGTASPAQKLDVSGNIKVGTNQWIGNSAGASYVADDGVFGGTIFNGGGFKIHTAAVERMRITSAGNVGIGTASPANSLTVFNAGANTTTSLALDCDSVGGLTVRKIGLTSVGGTVDSSVDFAYVDRTGSNASYLAFSTSLSNVARNVERMRIDTAGNVGIGTSSPNYKITLGGQTGATATPLALRFSNDFSNTSTAASSKIFLYNDGVAGNIFGFGVGSAADVQYHAGSTGASSGNHRWYTNDTERMRIDSAGNLGLGVTPSAWTTGGNIQLATSSKRAITTSGTVINLGTNWYYASGTNDTYIGTAAATNYEQNAGIHKWSNAPSGTAGTAITFTQAMTLDASGNLSVGTTSSGTNGKLYVYETTFARLYLTDSTLGTAYGGQVRGWGATASGGQVSLGAVDANAYNEGIRVTNQATTVQFYTTSGVNGTTTERMRINSSGNLGIGVTPSTWNVGKVVEIGSLGNAVWGTGASDISLMNNAYYNSGFYYANSSLGANRFEQYNGTYYWYTAPSGTAGTAITFTQAMTLDASGRLGIGIAPAAKLHSYNSAGGTTARLQTGTTANGNFLDYQNAAGTRQGIVGFIDSTNLYVHNDASASIIFDTNNTERMRIDSSGNVGIGTSSPLNKFTVLADGSVNTAGDTIAVGSSIIGSNRNFSTPSNPALFNINSNSTLGADVGGTLGFGGRYTSTSQAMFAIIKGAKENATDGNYSTYLAFGTRASGSDITERMRIDSSGNLLVNSTTSPSGSGNAFFNGIVYVGSTNTDPTFNRVSGLHINATGTINARANTTWDLGRDVTSGSHINFYTDNGSARVAAGSISSNGSTTTYATASDYRMKTDVQPMTNALSKIMQLNPVTYKWVNGLGGTKENGEGFIAHELQEVAPDCVTGEKDATREEEYEVAPAVPAVVDAEGVETTPAVQAVKGTRTVPSYQGIDTSFLVATLTAAIQEAHALIIQLQADVAALKGVKV